MRKITAYFFVAAAILSAVSCSNQSFKKTKSGLQYKIVSDGKGELATKGQFLKINFVQKVHDSILSTTANSFPEYIRIDSVGAVYNPAEVFPLLRKGDTATIVMMADTLARKYGNLPPFIKKKDKIILGLRVLDLFTSDSLVKKDQKVYIDAETAKEGKEIEAYLAKNNVTNAQKTKHGAYYQVLSQGSGPKVDSGKIVAVNYTGYTLDGTFFDSNTDSTKQTNRHPLTPFEFRAGVSGAVRGMVEAVLEFKKGDKGKLYIPAMLGYGPQGSGGVIKPFTNLVFDFEVVDVKDAPAQMSFTPGQQRMQQLQQMQQQAQQQKMQQQGAKPHK
jgi:FKBP-type peptidyl-prolyl cis-trans isomerase FkpA